MSLYDELKSRYRGFKKHPRGYGVEIETETQSFGDWPCGLVEGPDYDEELDHESGWSCHIPGWHVDVDGSLRNFGLEFISNGVQTYDEVLESLKIFGEKTKDVDFIKNAPHTSVHVHINMLEEEVLTMGNFVTLWFLYENILMEYSGETRKSNLFSMPARLAEHNVKNFVYLFNRLSKREKTPLNFSQEDSKYAALNIGCLPTLGSIEIRCFRGTTDVNEIIEWISILERMMAFSRQVGMTPDVIMSLNKSEPLPLFSSVFGEYRYRLTDKITDPEFFIFRNAWYAAQIAGAVEDWSKINTVYSSEEKKEEKKPKKKLDPVEHWLDEAVNIPEGSFWTTHDLLYGNGPVAGSPHPAQPPQPVLQSGMTPYDPFADDEL